MFIKVSTLLLLCLVCFLRETVFADSADEDFKAVIAKDGFEPDFSPEDNGLVGVIRNGYKKCTPVLCCPIHLSCGRDYFCWNMGKAVHPMRKCSKVFRV